MHKNMVMMVQPFFFPSKNQAFFSSLPLSSFSLLSDDIPCSLSGHEVEIHDELCPHNQNTYSTSLSSWIKLAMPFWVWWHFWDQLQGLGFWSTSQPKPKFHHVWQCSLQSFHHHLHGQQALYWHQHDFFFLIFTQQLQHKFACNMMHAQIFSENLKTRAFWNSNFCVMNVQTMLGTNKLSGCFLPFLMLKVILNIHCTKLKFSPL